jgi:hypothetical protein
MITDLKQIVVQDESLAGEKRVFIQHGPSIDEIQQISLLYNDLTQAEKDTWDNFVNLLKSKG